MVSALILDLDGTLIDSLSVHAWAFMSVFESMGYIVDKFILRSLFGMSASGIVKKAVPGISEVNVKRVLLRKERLFRSRINCIKAMPGARALLRRASRSFPVALATSSSRRDALLILKCLGLRDYFSVILTSDEVVRPKPAPDLILGIVKRLCVNVSDCLFVGDSVFDALSSRRAGVHFIGVATGVYSIKDFKRAGFKAVKCLCDISF